MPYVTLVMTKVSESYMNNLGFGEGYYTHNSTSMDIFPLWPGLQLISHGGIVKKIEKQTLLNHSIVTKLKESSNIKLITRTIHPPKKTAMDDNKTTIKTTSGIKGLMDTVLTYLLDGLQVPFVILFRYDPNKLVNGVCADDVSGSDLSNGKLLLALMPLFESRDLWHYVIQIIKCTSPP